MSYSKYEDKCARKKRLPSPMAFTAMVTTILFFAFITKFLNRGARQGHEQQHTYLATLGRPPPVLSKLVFVTAWIDLGPQHTEKTPAARLEHFKRLAASGISLLVFASPSNLAAMQDIQTEFPNVVGVHPVEMDSLQTVQTIRSFPNLTLPASLTNNKDTHGFLELMLTKIDFVYHALALTDATHLAWIDFNIAHVFDTSLSALEALQELQQRDLAPSLFAFPIIWGPQKDVDTKNLTEKVNWRFAGGFFFGDRRSLEQWYNLCSDTLRLFLAQTNVLVWEVNFWAWLENVYAYSFHPQVYTSDHDNSLVTVPLDIAR